jgi:hypothetical protein
MADNAENQKRIAELQQKESNGQLSDEEAQELQRLQNETSATTPTDGAK